MKRNILSFLIGMFLGQLLFLPAMAGLVYLQGTIVCETATVFDGVDNGRMRFEDTGRVKTTCSITLGSK